MAGLYIHIPFCHAKCYYCDFCSRPPQGSGQVDRYVERLASEIGERCTLAPTTVYIGGGTPSMLTPAQLGRVLEAVDLSECQELTIEVNPEDVTADYARSLAQLGFNRVSMGVQSLVDEELAAVGRRHSAAEAIEAYRRLREVGLDNISLDMIFGLPGQSMQSWQYSVDSLLALRPEHLSCYLLQYEEGTRLTSRLRRGVIEETPAEVCCRMYDYLCRAAASCGYEHYEISNFALPGRRSRHNSSYWAGVPYIGCGVSAHSLMPDGSRCYHSPKPHIYINEGWQATLTDDPEDAIDRLNDFIITRLRTIEGLQLSECERLHGTLATRELTERARTLPLQGSVIITSDAIKIPEHHWLISDTILRELIV